MSKIYTIKEVSKILKCNVNRVHELRKSGLDIPEGILTKEELIAELVRLKEEQQKKGDALCP